MLKQGSFLCHLFMWLLLPQLNQPLSPYTCDNCGDKCRKCIGSTEVPYSLGNDLEILYLSDNILDSITPKSFSIYRNIRELYFNNCSLKTIPIDTFSYLNNLELVDLSHNKISESLPETIFQANGNLNVVILNYNNFSKVKTAILSSGSIRTLHMIGCNITEVSSESFKHLPQLEELNLEKNKLKVLPPNLFSSLKYFSKLFIDHNTLVVQSCIPGLHVFLGVKILDCDTVISESTAYTTSGNSRYTTNRKVTPPNIVSRENETDSSKITNYAKYTQRTTFGLTKSTMQLSTNEKKDLTKSTASTPINTKEATRMFPNILAENVEIKIIHLLLLTTIVLLVTFILFISVKHCYSYCYSHSSLRQQKLECHPQFPRYFPETSYDRLIHSTENCTIPEVHLHGPVQTSPVPRYPNQVYRPVSMASQFSDHSYQEIIYNQNM